MGASKAKNDKKNKAKVKRDDLAGLSRKQKRKKLQERQIQKWAGADEMEKQTKQSISVRQAKKKARGGNSGWNMGMPEEDNNKNRGQKRKKTNEVRYYFFF